MGETPRPEIRCGRTECPHNQRQDQGAYSSICAKPALTLDWHGQCTEVSNEALGCARCSMRELRPDSMPEYT